MMVTTIKRVGFPIVLFLFFEGRVLTWTGTGVIFPGDLEISGLFGKNLAASEFVLSEF
jgi:hypothetical protein